MIDSKPYGVRLEGGDRLPQIVEETVMGLSSQFCDIGGFGELEWVDIAIGSPKETRHFEGPLQLVDLKGRVRRAGDIIISDFVCIVSRLTDNGIELLGGRLEKAKVVYAEVSITPLAVEGSEEVEEPSSTTVIRKTKAQKKKASKMASVVATADADGATLTPAGKVPVSYAKPRIKEELPSIKDRWKDALEVSKRVEDDNDYLGDEDGDVRPEANDLVNHMQFGVCTVLRVGDAHISLRKPDGRVIQLGLQVLQFVPAGEQDGKPLFDVRVKRNKS